MKTNRTTKILISDNNEIFLAGLAGIISKLPYVKEVCVARNKTELYTLLKELQFDIVCLDIDMIGINPKQLVRSIKRLTNMTQVILFSGWEDIKLIKSLINEGASGLISKHESINEVRDAIRAIKDKKLYASKSMQSAFQKDVYPFLEINAITLRLKEVLYLISHELSNKQISDCLQITPKTVEYHRAKLFKALGIKNTVGLGVYAVRSKIYYDPFLKKIYSKWLIKK